MSPIPLRPRYRPPVLPDQTIQTRSARDAAQYIPPATIGVVNIYDSDFTWPEDTRISALRVIQVLPKTTPPPNVPRIGIAQQTNARAVLGTVPVEEDGSIYFEAPIGKELYFQALDAQGMAVQSMRSGTYLHPGEQLTCQGCHEPKRRSPMRTSRRPLGHAAGPVHDHAGRRGLQSIQLRAPGAKCAGPQLCRLPPARKSGRSDGDGRRPHGWTRSYSNLAPKYGFYFDVTNGALHTGVHGGSRTIPGQFGARAASLLDYLHKDHYGVQLSHDDFHRLTLWLDCNSEFYGAYENPDAQSLGQVVQPSLD